MPYRIEPGRRVTTLRDVSDQSVDPMNLTAPQVRRISPMLTVAEMDVTLEFYTKVLGFEVAMK